jgi:hypothetical protein
VLLVTYDAGRGPRVGALVDGGVADLGFDGDMVAFIAAGAPGSPGERVEGARLLAPLRPRSLRDSGPTTRSRGPRGASISTTSSGWPR